MDKEFYIGQCLVCRQGMLEIVKEKATGKIIVTCDECEAEWDNPENALNKINGTRGKYGAVTEVTLNEIQRLHWDRYLK